MLGGARRSALGPGGGIIKTIQIMLLKLGMCRDVVSVAAGRRSPAAGASIRTSLKCLTN